MNNIKGVKLIKNIPFQYFEFIEQKAMTEGKRSKVAYNYIKA